MGYNKNINILVESFSANKELIALLLIDAEDVQAFFTEFYNKNRYMIDDLLDYREFRIAKDNKDFNRFEYDCVAIGLKDTFEKTFYQSFSSLELDLITQSINEGKTSLEAIFEGFKKNPNRNILKYVL